MLHLVLEPWF